MDEKFKKKYGIYDGIDTSAFKYIPEISFYNNNYDNKKGWQWSCLKGEDITYWMPIVKFDR